MAEEDSLIREVNEAVRQERWQTLWKNTGRYVIAASGIIVVATIGYVIWQNSTEARHEDTTAKLHAAITLVEEGKSFQAREQLEALSQSSDTSLAMLADVWLVKLKHQAGKTEEAATMAKALAEKSGYDAVYRDLAVFYTDNVEETPTGAFRHSAIEKQAVAALKTQDLKLAASHYHTLANDNDTPPSMRSRAQFLLQTKLAVYEPKTLAVPDESTPETPEADNATE